MDLVAQFKRKIESHGIVLTLLYSIEYALQPLWRRLWLEPVRKSYSQEREDLIIDKLLGHKSSGTYLDIGAFDPHHLSNTKRFYLRGWTGFNIEPNRTRYELFVEQRTRDTNLNMGIASSAGAMMFYEADDAAFSTFSAQQAQELQKIGVNIVRTSEVPLLPMRELFEKYVGARKVDFCTIDTEGMDWEVLNSNDWSCHRPTVICVELCAAISTGLNSTASLGASAGSDDFFRKIGYHRRATTICFGSPLNAIYVDSAVVPEKEVVK
jgi:FkbM family methyltransferase